MFTDTHCHIYQEYYEDIPLIFQNAIQNGVTHFFVAACDDASNKEVLQVISRFPFVYGCLGIHPESVDSYSIQDLSFLENHLQDPKVIAIGEIGLDYHYTKENRKEQIELLEYQMNLASKYHLPVVIHSRDATEDTISVLKKYPDVKGVIHSFSGSFETAMIYIKMGYRLGINGVITFKNSHLKDIVAKILPYIVLETDSPYLTPHPYRGTPNEPKYILNIAQFICENTGKTLEELAEITNKNIQEIFNISFD